MHVFFIAGSGCLATVLVPGHRDAEMMADLLRNISSQAGLSLTVAVAHYGITVLLRGGAESKDEHIDECQE
jgi:hypothetical protein